MGELFHSVEQQKVSASLTPFQKTIILAIRSGLINTDLVKREVSGSPAFKREVWKLLWELRKNDLQTASSLEAEIFPQGSFAPQQFPDKDYDFAGEINPRVGARKRIGQMLIDKRDARSSEN